MAARPWGRRSECETLDHIVAGIRTGVSQVVVFRGEAGVGKSALLDYLAAPRRNAESCGPRAWSPRWSSRSPAFMSSACRCWIGSSSSRAAGDALAIAFGLRSGESADRFFIGLATMTLLAIRVFVQVLA